MSHQRISRGLLPATTAILAFATASDAADLGPYRGRQQWNAPAAYYPQAFRWSGFYAGLQGGYGWGGTDATSITLGAGSGQSFSYSTSGAVGGVHAGYNWQSGSFVMGLETDLELSGIDGSGIGNFGGVHITNIDWLGSLRARAGIAAGSTLFYLTGGLAYGGISVDRTAGVGFVPFTGDSQWKTGWTLGGGIEHAFTPNISARIEYRYTDFGQITYTSPSAGITDTSDVTHSAVRAGLSFKF
jgi:outer membrane immunogenic protein